MHNNPFGTRAFRPETRSREIALLRRAVESGTYRVDAARVADRLIAESRRFARLSRPAAGKRRPG
jgi:hypothetical protein